MQKKILIIGSLIISLIGCGNPINNGQSDNINQDIYKGSNLEEGYKSIAISISYQSKDHTLKDDEILPVHNNILLVLQKELSAELRK